VRVAARASATGNSVSFSCVARCALFVWIGFSSVVYAQFGNPISEPPTPIGAGARAAGMADAFVAIADDATAASWNPAGLAQLEKPEFSIAGSFRAVREEFISDAHAEIEKTFRYDAVDLNFASLVYPIPRLIAGRKSIVSISYQRKFDMFQDHEFPIHTLLTASDGTTISIDEDFRLGQEGSLNTISPALAIELTRKLSVGVTVNLWRDSFISDNTWTQTENQHSTLLITDIDIGPLPAIENRVNSVSKYSNIRGENYTLGLLWKVAPKWKIGIRYDSKFTARADFERRSVRNGVLEFESEESRKITFPSTLAVGAAWRVNDGLTLAVDVSTTDWNDYVIESADGTKFSPVDGLPRADKDIATDFDDTVTVRFGAEYVLLPKILDSELKYLWTLRGGLFYDEEPASGRQGFTVSKGDGEPDSFYGFTLGAGLLIRQRVNFDIAYQLRKGDGVNTDVVPRVLDFEEDVLEHKVLLSAVIYF